MPITPELDEQFLDDEIRFARGAQSDVFGKLDVELPKVRFNGEADMELERKWRTAGCGSKSEFIRLVLYVNLYGAAHIQNLQAARLLSAIGNAASMPPNGGAE